MGCNDLTVKVEGQTKAEYRCAVNGKKVDQKTKIIEGGECPNGYYLKNQLNG